MVFIPNIEALKAKQSSNPSCRLGSHEIILLSDFPTPAELKALCINNENIWVFGLPSLYAMRFENICWVKPRPVFSFAMRDAIIAITGFRDPIVVVNDPILYLIYGVCFNYRITSLP